jgi:hypothetical protein
MYPLLLQAQAWWDAQRFDQPVWQLAEWRDQKVRHIQLHVAKALGKVVAALDKSKGEVFDTDRTARLRDEVLPDVAIYRSQLINTFPDCCGPTMLLCRPRATTWSAAAPLPGRAPHTEPLFHVMVALSRASARLATYLEPREHGAVSPICHIREAIQDLHHSAEALAAYFTVDLAWAHQTRLEALLGTPLPASLVQRGRPDP